MSSIIEKLSNLKILPVIKIENTKQAVPLAHALRKGGLPAAEITFRTAAAEEVILCLSQQEPDILIAAGTVLDVDTAQRATKAGAKAIVSPGLNPDVVDWCLENDITVIPGCFTPSEVEWCIRKGLTSVKLFPAEVAGGIKMLKSLAGPYPNMRFMPTGGITAENVGTYLKLPNVFCCGGSWIAPADRIAQECYTDITFAAAQAISSIQDLKG